MIVEEFTSSEISSGLETNFRSGLPVSVFWIVDGIDAEEHCSLYRRV